MNDWIVVIFVLLLFMFSVWGMEDKRVESIIGKYLEIDKPMDPYYNIDPGFYFIPPKQYGPINGYKWDE